MGGQQSKNPRTVSFENDSAEGLIDISQDVVDRLKNQRGMLHNRVIAIAKKPLHSANKLQPN